MRLHGRNYTPGQYVNRGILRDPHLIDPTGYGGTVYQGVGRMGASPFANLFTSATNAANQVQSAAAQAQMQAAQLNQNVQQAETYVGTYAGLTLLFQGLTTVAMLYLVYADQENKRKKRR